MQPEIAPNTLRLQENVLLAPLTTFGIGGAARWFASVNSVQELADACRWAAERQLQVFVLGGGSNVVVSDAGFAGLVIHIALRGISVVDHPADGTRSFTAAAGEDWDALVTRTVEADCAGMECLAGIPGLVGGTPVQNVGAYGQEVAQTIAEVRCWDRTAAEIVTFPAESCGFAYRTSRFNSLPDQGRYIVTAVTFALKPGGSPSLAYADLQRRFAGQAAPSLSQVASTVREIRREKGMVIDPGPLALRDPDTRSAGSYFKNPIVPEAVYQSLADLLRPLNVPSYPAPDSPEGPRRKLPAAWLLEQAGFRKGFTLGGAAVSSRHTLALTNRSGHATTRELLALEALLVDGIWQRFRIRLEPEPVFVGALPEGSTRAELL